jgi:hypothetical protein
VVAVVAMTQPVVVAVVACSLVQHRYFRLRLHILSPWAQEVLVAAQLHRLGSLVSTAQVLD